MSSHPHQPGSILRQRMIEDMSLRKFSEKARKDYIRHVRTFAAFLGRSPDSATPDDLRRFQLHQSQSGVQPPTINSSVAAPRFFFNVTADRPELARYLSVAPRARKLPVVLSEEEVARLLDAGARHQIQSGAERRLRGRTARLGGALSQGQRCRFQTNGFAHRARQRRPGSLCDAVTAPA